MDVLRYLGEQENGLLLLSAPDSRGGCTPAHWAAAGGHVNVLRYMGERPDGATLLTAKADGGHTPARLAEAGGHAEALRYLREHGGKQLLAPFPSAADGAAVPVE